MATKGRETRKPGDPIGYITPDIPDFEVPQYEGERYEVTVPDTLELQEHAQFAIHNMTEATDPEADYEPYYIIGLRDDPPVMVHNSWHGSVFSKYPESVSLMRIMTGSRQNTEVDRRWMEVTLKMQGPDGLAYTPTRGRPWANWETAVLMDNSDYTVHGDQQISAFGNGRTLSTMSLFARRDGGPLWRDATRRLVDGLIELAVDAGDMAYFWPTIQLALKGGPADGRVPTPWINGESSVVPHGLVHAYLLLGYEPALDLAGKVINYLRRNYFGPDGTFFSTPGNPRMAHFHTHSHGLLTMQDYAQTAGDQELMEFVVRSFQWARDSGANLDGRGWRGWDEYVNTPGGSLIGYFPEHLGSDRPHGSEICEVSDMIALAMKLSEAGLGDYWDDADRWIRNMLVEGQLTSTDWVHSLPHADLIKPDPPSPPANPYVTTDRVAERSLGAFAGWPTPNEWGIRDQFATMQCCTVNGARALYWIWERVLRHQNGKLRVNLLLNRASPWADIDSYIPYQGRVDVKIKHAVDLEMRIPEWVSPDEARCEVSGGERRLGWNGRYAQVGQVNPGEVATLTFPISERTDVVFIEKEPYTLLRKGNEVVSIDPPGRHYPLFKREHYRQDSPGLRKVERFVPKEWVDW